MNYTQQEVDQAIEYLAISASNNIPPDNDDLNLDVKVWQLINDLLDTVESYYTVADIDSDPLAEAESWLRCGWRQPGDELTFEVYMDTAQFLKDVEQRMADAFEKNRESADSILQRTDERDAHIQAQGWKQLELPLDVPPSEQMIVSSFVQLTEPAVIPAVQEEDPEASPDDPVAMFT